MMVPRQYDFVIFDMDGTLIEPLLDFSAIRAELGIPPGGGILEAIASMPPARQVEAHRTLVDHELSAARRARLLDGAGPTLAAIARAGLKTALLTRSAQEAMDTVLRRFDLTFDLTWSREAGVIKPEPDGVLRACRTVGVEPGRTMCVGDFRYDIEAANAAGTTSVLLVHDERPDFAVLADHVIGSLTELPGLLGI